MNHRTRRETVLVGMALHFGGEDSSTGKGMRYHPLRLPTPEPSDQTFSVDTGRGAHGFTARAGAGSPRRGDRRLFVVDAGAASVPATEAPARRRRCGVIVTPVRVRQGTDEILIDPVADNIFNAVGSTRHQARDG